MITKNSYGLPLGTLQALKERSEGPTNIFSGYSISYSETINNFITRLEKLAEHCDDEGERDNQLRDRAIYFLKDKNLKSK